MSKNIYLITGGCGFIGSALIRQLLKDKNNTVINIDKLTYASNPSSIGNTNGKNYSFFQEDIINASKIDNIIRKYEPNFVIHLAAESHVDRSIDSPESFILTNVLGTYHLLEVSYKYWNSLDEKNKKQFKFLLVSTDEVYGSLSKTEDSFVESNSYKPNSPYAASKASADHLARAWNKTYGFPVITTNTCNNYGKWQFPEKLIPLVISKCLSNEKIPVYGDGQQIRDWIHVDDHISGLLFALENGSFGSKYNIGSNKELTNINVVKSICSLLDKIKPKADGSYQDLIEFVIDRPGHDSRYSINSEKIMKLGWKPLINWETGIEDTIKWYLDNIDFLNNKFSGERLGKLSK